MVFCHLQAFVSTVEWILSNDLDQNNNLDRILWRAKEDFWNKWIEYRRYKWYKSESHKPINEWIRDLKLSITRVTWLLAQQFSRSPCFGTKTGFSGNAKGSEWWIPMGNFISCWGVAAFRFSCYGTYLILATIWSHNLTITSSL